MDDELEIQAKILDLSTLLIQHSDYTKKRSSLIYFTGVLGYNLQWKQWRQPLEYTTILAGLQFYIRVIMVEAALPMAVVIVRRTMTEEFLLSDWLFDSYNL